MTNSTVDRNVVITFDVDLADELIKLSQDVGRKVASKINLNHENEIPHITLYMSKYPEKNVGLIINKLTKIANSTKPFKLKLNSKSCHATGTIFIDVEMSDELYTLHERLVNGLNSLREGLFNEDELTLPGITEEKKRSLKEFGMWAVKQAYIPHVSVGRIYDLKDCEIALGALSKEINYETLVKNIAFVERGHDGTCKKILKTFPLLG